MNKIPLGTLSALSILALITGCVETPRATQLPDKMPAAQASLEDSQWRLVEFQSMDDSQGVARPEKPDDYRMKLMAGGRVAFKLDCNRGMGDWSFTPSSDGTSGSISFSQLAVTKAYCPPPSMGETLERDTQYMSSYILRDGRLNISLMADGGIYVWEPAVGEE